VATLGPAAVSAARRQLDLPPAAKVVDAAHLPAADVDRLLAVCDRATPLGLRDRAVLLLLARLGLCAGDIRALAIGDVDWQQASVRVAGRSRTHVRLPLTQEVGDALVDYLTRGRPPAETDRVFLRVLAPWRPLTVSAVSRVVDRAMARAGVTAPCRGAHVLRQSAATEMLRQGATLDQIGAVLRHRYMDSFQMKVPAYLLRSFTAFAEARGETHVRTTSAIAWAALAPSERQRANRLGTVRIFAQFAKAEDPDHEIPPDRVFAPRRVRYAPFILSEAQLKELLQRAARLPPPQSLRPWTYCTLFSLLAVTGLRISEALALTLDDVTADGLVIRKTKFRKSRLVPLHPSAAAGLTRYLDRRGVHGEFQNAEEVGDSCTGEHLRDMRAQVATFTVRISQTERLDVEERQIGQSHPRMRSLPGPSSS
jgi:integrase